MDLFRKAWLVRPVWYCRTYASESKSSGHRFWIWQSIWCFRYMTLTIVSIGSLMRYTTYQHARGAECRLYPYSTCERTAGEEASFITMHSAISLIPIITLLGGTLPGLFGGAMVTETLFQIPGIGYTSYQCLVLQGDIPFTMFYMTVSCSTDAYLATCLQIFCMQLLDPRVRIN